MNDEIQAWLGARGAPDFVIAQGVEGLLRTWEDAAINAAAGRVGDAFDYFDQLDRRQILFEIQGTFGLDGEQTQRLERADELFRTGTREQEFPVWNRDEGDPWTPDVHWWYYRAPKAPLI
jgi:hypothetical protein